MEVPFLAERVQRRACAGETAEPTFGLAPRRIGIHARVDELARSHLEVEGQLVVDFPLDWGPPPDTVEGVAGHYLDNPGIGLDGRLAHLVATNCNNRFVVESSGRQA